MSARTLMKLGVFLIEIDITLILEKHVNKVKLDKVGWGAFFVAFYLKKYISMDYIWHKSLNVFFVFAYVQRKITDHASAERKPDPPMITGQPQVC